MKSFSSQVEERIATYEKRLNAVFKASVQDAAEEMTRPMAKGGRMRVDTGFLRASLMASTSAPPRINPTARPRDGASYRPDGTVEAVILGASIDSTIYLGFTASYAGVREYKDGFVEAALLNWDAIVQRNARKAIRAFP
ncbi:MULTISPECIES: hypothetical protein [unclassified Haematobacter]|uniref:hypothetical protein n=1 Tax=unclassified Haematobacter TaxID=2640585 RepID=UPI0025B9875F|nr:MULTISPECIES: hypothetical protein [unclassified Haematobacter]